MHARKRLISVELLAELVEARGKRGDVRRSPPVGQPAVRVIFRALVVEMVAELMADHRSDPAVIDRRVGVGIEEWRLQDRRREDNLDHAEIGVGVDRHGGHAPFPFVDRLAQLTDIVGVIELVRAHRVAEQVAPVDDQARHIAPLRRIADLRSEGGELGVRADLGLGRHPVEFVDPPVHRRDDVVNERVRRRLGLRREETRDVELADVVAERSDGEIHRPLPARFLLRRAGKRRAVESEILLVESRRQIG